ncbi:MAG: hypothetical protein AAFY88_05340, partial [Acidobacteriota bacterium]
DKSTGGNRTLSSHPRFGDLVAAPGEIAGGAPGDARPWPALLGYAWNGASATLAGVTLSERGGVVEIETPGSYALRVDGSDTESADVEEEVCTGGPLLCLNQDRFVLEVDWRDFDGNRGRAQVVPFGTPDSGLFYFFDADNWEMLVKVLDGCTFNGHFWVFAAATTNVEYSLTVTDTVSGLSKAYFNPLGVSAAAVTDTEALAACSSDASEPGTEVSADDPLASGLLAGDLEKKYARMTPSPAVSEKPEIGTEAGECTDGPTELCVQQERFTVEVEWADFEGNTGPGRVVAEAESNDSGIFYFFAEDNWEMLVKVLDGCTFNGHYWVFAAATTNVGYTLTVTDGATGDRVSYRNPLGVSSPAITDAMALPTCP